MIEDLGQKESSMIVLGINGAVLMGQVKADNIVTITIDEMTREECENLREFDGW